MDNNEFDAFFKNKIKEEKQLITGNNIDKVIDRSFKKAREKNKLKFMYKKTLIAATMFFVITSITITVIKQNEVVVDNGEIVVEKSNQKELAVVDIAKEKEKLKQEGYIVDKGDIRIEEPVDSNSTSTVMKQTGNANSPVDNNTIIDNGPYVSACKAYSMTLKDQVFSADCVVKGRLVGVSYYTNDRQTYTKAKVLVEESYDSNLKCGEIITINKSGGIITQYQFMLLKGIDKKFNISNEELEKAKNQMVVSDNYDGKLLYPDDSVILLLNESQDEDQNIKEGEYLVSGTVVEFKDNEIIKSPYAKGGSVYFTDLEDDAKEFYAYDKVTDLEEKLITTIEEKKDFSKDKARQAAYNSLSEEDKKRINNIDKADVTYHRSMKIFNGNSVNELQIDVRLLTNDENTKIFVSMDEEYKIINIIK